MLENGVYTHDLIIKARRLGIKPNELLQAQAKALHSIGKLNGYSQLGEDFPDNETAIWEAVSNANKKDLLYLLRRKGIENFTPSQFKRLRDFLASEAELQHGDREAANLRETGDKTQLSEKQMLTEKEQQELYPYSHTLGQGTN